jgi:hypothetical protein
MSKEENQLTLSEMYVGQTVAILNVLERKGIMTKEEYNLEYQVVKESILKEREE